MWKNCLEVSRRPVVDHWTSQPIDKWTRRQGDNQKSTERQNDKLCLASVELSDGTSGEVLGKAITIIRSRIPDRRPVQNRFQARRCKEHFAFHSEVLLTADAKKTILRWIPKCSLQQAKNKMFYGLGARARAGGSGSGWGLGARARGVSWRKFVFILFDKYI